MKTKAEATRLFLAAGWTPVEIKSVLGSVPELDEAGEPGADSPWWTFLDEDQYTDGTPIVRAWEAWVEQGKPQL